MSPPVKVYGRALERFSFLRLSVDFILLRKVKDHSKLCDILNKKIIKSAEP